MTVAVTVTARRGEGREGCGAEGGALRRAGEREGAEGEGGGRREEATARGVCAGQP